MSLESAKKFFADVQVDAGLQARLDKGSKTASQDEKLEGIVSAAKAEGYDFTVAELKEAALIEAELSPDELENATGVSNCVTFGGGDQCVAFAAGDCKCFGSGGHCKCFGDNCKAVFT